MSQRRKSRIISFQALYMFEVAEYNLEKIISLDWVTDEKDETIINFSKVIINGTIEHLELVDSIIKKYSKNWKFNRIDVIDKSILRVSIFSLLFLKEIPAAVTIDEAIEITKIYGGNNSPVFINGVLDAVNKNEIKREG